MPRYFETNMATIFNKVEFCGKTAPAKAQRHK